MQHKEGSGRIYLPTLVLGCGAEDLSREIRLSNPSLSMSTRWTNGANKNLRSQNEPIPFLITGSYKISNGGLKYLFLSTSPTRYNDPRDWVQKLSRYKIHLSAYTPNRVLLATNRCFIGNPDSLYSRLSSVSLRGDLVLFPHSFGSLL